MGAVRSLCPTSIMLSNGEIDFVDETDQVIRNYINKYNFRTDGEYHVDCNSFDHSGSGEARILWAEIRNSNNDGVVDFHMDEEIVIQFGIKNPLHFNLDYAIEILDQNDYPLFHFWSSGEDVQKTDNKNLIEQQIVKAIIPPLQLFPDHYYVNLWVGLNTRRVDKIEKCFRITIKKDPKIKRDLLVTRGRFYQKASWKLFY